MHAFMEAGDRMAVLNTQHGYVYRFKSYTQTQLRELIRNYVQPGIVLEYDIVTLELHKFQDANEQQTVPLLRDSGHAFGRDAEVRWRRDDDTFDVLLLMESEQPILDLGADEQIGKQWNLRMTQEHEPEPIGERTQLIMSIPQERADYRIVQYIKYRQYAAPNGAVQFVRHCYEE